MSDAYTEMFFIFTYPLIFKKENHGNSDFFKKRPIQYQHHETNYKEALNQNIIPFALRIKELPDIQPISKDFSNPWNTILYDT